MVILVSDHYFYTCGAIFCGRVKDDDKKKEDWRKEEKEEAFRNKIKLGHQGDVSKTT